MANAKKDNQAKAVKGYPMVKVTIPLTPENTDAVFVSSGCGNYLIQRGVEVEVPEPVALELAKAQQLNMQVIRKKQKLEQYLIEESRK